MEPMKRGGNNPATPASSLAGDVAVEGAELAALLDEAVCGGQEAWRRIVGLYWRRVFALARSRLRDVSIAEEVTQSVFVTIATKLSQGHYAERGKFEPWLFRVAMNRIRDHVRATSRGAVSVDDVVLNGRAAAEAKGAGVSDEALNELRRALGLLGESDRLVIELRHHAGLSFACISELVDEPLGTLLARHHRALRKLRDLLAGVEDSVMEDR